jgi:hypothetical protein
MKNSGWLVGMGRRKITPFPGVELAGLGYYLKRTWDCVHDDLNATAMVISDEHDHSAALLALDLLYMDGEFVNVIRKEAATRTGLGPQSICVNCSHSHNVPTLAFFDGAGEINPEYARQVVGAAAEALEAAWSARVPARLRVGAKLLPGITYNRTREGGAVDDRLSVLRADSVEGKPLGIAVNFHAHPTVFWQVEPRSVSRDCVGQMVDDLEKAMPGAIALYLQGSCGDVNYNLDYWTKEHYAEVGLRLSEAAQAASSASREIPASGIQVITREGFLPVRRWTRQEVLSMYEEGKHRLETGDRTGWLEGIASKMVGLPARLPERYGGSVARAIEAVSRFAVRWGEDTLPKLDSLPETRAAEFQAMRIGDVWLVTNASEFFSSLALEIRRRWPHEDLFILGYSNGSLSYLPDAYEVDRGSYASLHVPKAVRAFPFTRDAGMVAVEHSLAALRGAEQTSS